MAARKPLVAGNWKMNGLMSSGPNLAAQIAERAETGMVDVVLCPPFTLTAAIAEALKGSGVFVGAQDCHYEADGAYTGDISPVMLKEIGVSHVILGHSERRAYHGEPDEEVKAKAEAAHAAGLTAIICVGETEAQRDAGETLSFLSTQLYNSVPAGADAENTVIAYEPVWAIGTGRTATPDQAEEAQDHIRNFGMATFGAGFKSVRILYGGSMKPGNAAELMAQPAIDGGLIGGASLKAEDFLAIVAAAASSSAAD
ncbi:MAG: triose-phosphate isomerase [Alphaproteobacteria bacterium]|nr:triose-phosphate isomerase [Alphaproteobacteria bacterium]